MGTQLLSTSSRLHLLQQQQHPRKYDDQGCPRAAAGLRGRHPGALHVPLHVRGLRPGGHDGYGGMMGYGGYGMGGFGGMMGYGHYPYMGMYGKGMLGGMYGAYGMMGLGGKYFG